MSDESRLTANPSSSGSELHGVLSVLCTPFSDTGELDLSSLQRLVTYSLENGVDGVVCFGLAGENYKLSDHERRAILRVTMDAVEGKVPVVAGTEHNSIEGAVARSREAQDLGARALMLLPPTFVSPTTSQVLDYYAKLDSSVSVPIVIQDAPAWSRVILPVEVLTEIRRTTTRVRYVKVESPPTAPKITSLSSVGFKLIGGYGALYLLEELQAGVIGFMPGCAMPRLYRDLWAAHLQNDQQSLWSLFSRVLPLLSFQLASLDTFVSVQKTLLYRRGILSSPRLREPAASLSSGQMQWLHELIIRTGVGDYVAR